MICHISDQHLHESNTHLHAQLARVIGIGGRLLWVSYARINPVASIPPMKRPSVQYDMYTISAKLNPVDSHTYEYDIKGPIPLHARPERIHRK